jgi:hypothetical protein
MYAAHVPTIANAMRSDVDLFRRGALFAICSIRQPVVNVPSQLADIDRDGRNSAYLFGFKREGYDWLQINGRGLWRDLEGTRAPGDAIAQLVAVPSLGVVKAGFVAQLMGYDVGCLDSRNVQRMGLRPRAWDLDKGRLSPAAIERKAHAYAAATLGQAENLWDSWCAYVAPDYKLTPLAVSELHLAIVPDSYIPF